MQRTARSSIWADGERLA